MQDKRIVLDANILIRAVLGKDQLEEIRIEATERISQRDPDDWPAVAAALQLGCPVWTEDEDFFGSGATWTTGTVEIFFRGGS